jgi:hypothetical protein
MTTEDKLRKLFAILLKSAQNDPKLLSEIEQVFDGRHPGAAGRDRMAQDRGKPSTAAETDSSRSSTVPAANEVEHPPRPKNRRKAAPFDPYVVYQEGEEALSRRLRDLDIEALRDMLAEFAMDPSKLAIKWKSIERITDHIISTVRARVTKGDAFRT